MPKLNNESISVSDSEIDLNEGNSQEAVDCIVFFINETALGQSPQVEIVTNKISINAIIDSGSEVNLISEEIYGKLIKAGAQIPVLPVENVVLVTAFGKKSKRIRQQVLIEFTMEDDFFECIFLISSQLKNEAIIGCQFLKEYGICIDFCREIISYVRGDVKKELAFVNKDRIRSARRNDPRQAREPILQNNPSAGQKPEHPSADCGDHVITRPSHSCSKPTPHQTLATSHERVLKGGNSNCVETQCRMMRELKGRVSPVYGAECDHLSRVYELPDTEIYDEVNIQSQGSVDRNAASDINVDVMYVKRGLQVGDPCPRPKPHPPDPRSLKKCDVSSSVEQVISLSEPQRKELYETLKKYMDHMTTKPGRCNLLEYKFQVSTDKHL
jgi:hypothetical protein